MHCYVRASFYLNETCSPASYFHSATKVKQNKIFESELVVFLQLHSFDLHPY